jgi:D-lactate dehydrogenase (cytochrome)
VSYTLTWPSTRRPIPAGFFAALGEKFGARLSRKRAVCEQHGRDESPYAPAPPDGVVFATSIEEVAWLAKHCNTHRVPLIAYGAGSSLEGQILAVEGGITLDLSRMNHIVSIDADDFTATVEAGVTREQLNEALRYTGLYFPVDPGADASLGGMAATRASGTNAVRYGTMRDNVVRLRVVTADGRVIRTASRARKSSAGYDLTHLFVGSEGTLGIITEVTVRLHPRPAAILAAVCNFPSLDSAVASVTEIVQTGIPIARVEFMDAAAVRATNAYSKLVLRDTPLLLFEFQGGDEAAVKQQATEVRAITDATGGRDFEWATRPEDRSRLWKARHAAYFAGLQLRPGSRPSTTDVCVPISKLAQCVSETAAELDRASFPYTIVGHVGDGNFHVLMLVDPNDARQWQECERINSNLVHRAIAMDGTCTGEHGIGLHKQAFMQLEHGESGVDLMRAVKRALDPNNVLNPAKVIPEFVNDAVP